MLRCSRVRAGWLSGSRTLGDSKGSLLSAAISWVAAASSTSRAVPLRTLSQTDQSGRASLGRSALGRVAHLSGSLGIYSAPSS